MLSYRHFFQHGLAFGVGQREMRDDRIRRVVEVDRGECHRLAAERVEHFEGYRNCLFAKHVQVDILGAKPQTGSNQGKKNDEETFHGDTKV